YFDWVKELESYPKTTRFSSPNSLIVALSEVLRLFEEVGMDAVKTRCRILAETTRLGAEELGLKVFSKNPSSSVTAIELPEGVDGQKLRSWLETEKNITVMGGQDQLKGKVLRIGHMGAIYNDDLLAFFDALMEGLNLPEPMEFKHHLSKSLFPSLEYFA
ncbi:MAG TPA: aminotransferase, partial [Bdellovibrionales bacterium]|nr:aminotransferase [Bdellovibrionales bacterium]